MTLVVDDQHLGTSEATWRRSQPLRSLPPLAIPSSRRAWVVSPHPDDEILGCGGLLQTLCDQGVDVRIVAVSDGEASHPDAADTGCDVRGVRTREVRRALDRLGCGQIPVTRLGLPDGAIAAHVDHLAAWLAKDMSADDLYLSPWARDGHPDHNACGFAAARAAQWRGAHLLEYLVWAWHWGRPDDESWPWDDCRTLQLSRRTVARKRWATHAFVSQTRPFGSGYDQSPVLPPAVMRRFWRPFEVFIDTQADA